VIDTRSTTVVPPALGIATSDGLRCMLLVGGVRQSGKVLTSLLRDSNSSTRSTFHVTIEVSSTVCAVAGFDPSGMSGGARIGSQRDRGLRGGDERQERNDPLSGAYGHDRFDTTPRSWREAACRRATNERTCARSLRLGRVTRYHGPRSSTLILAHSGPLLESHGKRAEGSHHRGPCYVVVFWCLEFL
jgi:hypothetical protein